MIKRLFISYSTVDGAIADKVQDQLAEAGYDVWIAHRDIKGSVDWTQTILHNIDSKDGMVLVWSESAAESPDVREEIGIARVFQKPIFPILAHPKTIIPSLPEEIKTLQVIEFGSIDLNIAELKIDLPILLKAIYNLQILQKTVSYRKHRTPFLSAEVVNSRIFL